MLIKFRIANSEFSSAGNSVITDWVLFVCRIVVAVILGSCDVRLLS